MAIIRKKPFLFFAIAMLVAICFSTADVFAKEKVFRLRFAHVNSESAMVHKEAVYFADRLEEVSGGRLKLEIFPNASLGSETQLIEMVDAGLLDLAATTAMGIGALVPQISVLDAAFVLKDYNHQVKVVNGPVGKELFDLVAAKTNFVVVACPTYGVRHLTVKNRKVQEPSDASGLKVRAMNFEQAMLNVKSLGATPIPVPFAELYTSLQQRIVDGQENPLNTILASKFYEVQDYVCLTGHVVTNGPFIMSKRKWDKLPNDLKEIVAQVGQETNVWAAKLATEKESEWLNELVDRGMTAVEISPAAREKFIENAKNIIVPAFAEKWDGYYERISAADR
ncbi:hypothetical protein DSCW_05670 [Desulfosarcina widdelii]|uniref:C4-dicarboxylate ABC transporter substrate-binding protein n=1 Tax=Desulfosarcina widdelii TaxID=947919 RepID=A0A5K7YXS5_9BACT|nr:TRAP transporter substrate-binding protein [Desulfosarcina widdelii]BBO73150.1 hypothetical protein DSCW_05670 [Desulfosarcina widdelii]